MAGIPTGDVNDLRGLIDHPQLAARDRWTTAQSSGGPVRVLRSPFNLEGMVERPASIPDLGADTNAVLSQLDARTATNEASADEDESQIDSASEAVPRH